MVLVIIVIGVIGSMASIILYEGSVVFTSETNRQGFVSQSRNSLLECNAQFGSQANQKTFIFLIVKTFIPKMLLENKEFRIHDSGC